MNNYIILRRYKDQEPCVLAKYVIFEDKIYLTNILINKDDSYSFTKVYLYNITSALQLRKEYNIDFVYTYSSRFKYFYGGKIEPTSLSIVLNKYDITFESEFDEDAKLRFEVEVL